MPIIFGTDGCLTGNKGIYTLANSPNNLYTNLSKLNQFSTNIEFSFNNFTSAITSTVSNTGNIINIPNKDTNTINYNGDIYKLHNIQHCVANTVQDPSMSEVYFTFYNNNKQSPYLIILSYLIRYVSSGEINNNFMSEMLQQSPIPTSTNKSILEFTKASSDHYAYHTCIPCNIKDGAKTIKNGSIKALCFVGNTVFNVVRSNIKELSLKKYKYISINITLFFYTKTL